MTQTTSMADNDDELQAAAALVLQREQRRERRAATKARRRMSQRHKQQAAAIEQMRRSIEVIKWCIMGLAVVVAVGLIFLGWSANKAQEGIAAIEHQVTRIETDVDEIEKQVDHVKNSLLRPIETLGRTFGSELDEKLKSLMENKANKPQE